MTPHSITHAPPTATDTSTRTHAHASVCAGGSHVERCAQRLLVPPDLIPQVGDVQPERRQIDARRRHHPRPPRRGGKRRRSAAQLGRGARAARSGAAGAWHGRRSAGNAVAMTRGMACAFLPQEIHCAANGLALPMGLLCGDCKQSVVLQSAFRIRGFQMNLKKQNTTAETRSFAGRTCSFYQQPCSNGST